MMNYMQPSIGPSIGRMSIPELVGMIRNNLNSGLSGIATNRIYEILQNEYPEYRYQKNFNYGDLELQLLKGIQENSPVVLAFIENETKSPNYWKWRTHFVEIAGSGAVISNLLSSIKSPAMGTWRSHSSLKEPLYLNPFATGSRVWSYLSKPWEGCSVTLAFFGHAHDQTQNLVSVRLPVQFP